MVRFLTISRRDWEVIYPFFNQYLFNDCNIENKYIKVSSSFLKEHLRMVKHDKITDLTDQIKNSYQSLIDEIKNISFCNEIIIEIIDDSFNYKESLFIKDIQESFIEYIDEVGLFVDSCEDNHVGKFLNDNFDQDIFSYVRNNLGIEDYFDYWAYAIAFLIDEGFIKQMDFPDPYLGTIYYKDGYVIIDSLLEREGKR